MFQHLQLFTYHLYIPKKHKRILLAFDIDGVTCNISQNEIYENICEYTDQQYLELKEKDEITEEFCQNIENIQNFINKHPHIHIDIVFITGRKPFVKSITESMFRLAGLEWLTDKICYFPSNVSWKNKNFYHQFKWQILLAQFENYDKIYFIDDNIDTINYLKKHLPQSKYQIMWYSNQRRKN